MAVSWLKWSSLNQTFHGYATSELTEPIEVEVIAQDSFGGECTMKVIIDVSPSTTHKWPYFVGIFAVIILAVVIIAFFVHCVFIGSKWGDTMGQFLFRKQQAKSI